MASSSAPGSKAPPVEVYFWFHPHATGPMDIKKGSLGPALRNGLYQTVWYYGCLGTNPESNSSTRFLMPGCRKRTYHPFYGCQWISGKVAYGWWFPDQSYRDYFSQGALAFTHRQRCKAGPQVWVDIVDSQKWWRIQRAVNQANLPLQRPQPMCKALLLSCTGNRDAETRPPFGGRRKAQAPGTPDMRKNEPQSGVWGCQIGFGL